MGTVTKLKARPRPPAKELPERLIEDADRPEHRYLGTPLLELLTSGELPRAALKDYAIQRWAFQAHANPAMMLSHAAFLEGDDVEHLLENAYDEIFRLAGEGDHPGLWVQFAKLLGATDAELDEAARKPLAEVIGFPRTMTHYCRKRGRGLATWWGDEAAAKRTAYRARAVLRLRTGPSSPTSTSAPTSSTPRPPTTSSTATSATAATSCAGAAPRRQRCGRGARCTTASCGT
jgi:hypothetical protein